MKLDMVSEFMCPCPDHCGKALEVCECSDKAGYVQEIRALELANLTPGQIRDKFIEKYGPTVMASPPAHGFGLVAYVLPPLAVTFAALLVLAIVLRWRRKVQDVCVSASDLKRAEEMLKKWDS